MQISHKRPRQQQPALQAGWLLFASKLTKHSQNAPIHPSYYFLV
jgi:hypothetical protein